MIYKFDNQADAGPNFGSLFIKVGRDEPGIRVDMKVGSTEIGGVYIGTRAELWRMIEVLMEARSKITDAWETNLHLK